MGKRISCPIPEYDTADKQGNPVYWVELPERWDGEHASRYDDAIATTRDSGLGDTLRTFIAALALCDAWNLPEMSMQAVESKEVGQVPLEVIVWVNQVVVINSYRLSSTCPKGYSVPFSVLARIAETENSDGESSEKT